MKKIICILIVFGVILLFVKISIQSEENYGDLIQTLKVPLYPSAYDVVSTQDITRGTKHVSFKVKITFPASDLIAFYERKMSDLGFVPYYSDGYGLRRWEAFNHKTGDWDSTLRPPARYIATWSDSKQMVRIVLVINAYDEESPKLINISIQKFFDFSKLNKFNERLKREGKLMEFYNLIEKYTDKNRKIDLKKALEENPENEYLKEFILLQEKREDN